MSMVGPRSLLSTPATDPGKAAKALASAADQVILDLEDSVGPLRKAEALDNVLHLARTAQVGRRLSVRINAAGSAWQAEEVRSLAAAGDGPLTLLVPKAESASELAEIAGLLTEAERSAGRSEPVQLQALIESARGLADLAAIAASTPRLNALVIGYADLAASLGRPIAGDPARWLGVQDAVLIAARSRGLAALDGPLLQTADDEHFHQACDRAKALGFDGKWVIHPRQLDTANRVFSPSEQEVAAAKEVLAALDKADSAGAGVLQLDGQMIDEAVAVSARRVLERAQRSAISSGAGG